MESREIMYAEALDKHAMNTLRAITKQHDFMVCPGFVQYGAITVWL